MLLLKLLHVASSLLSPPLLTLQLLMPTKMRSTAWLTALTFLNPTPVRQYVGVAVLLLLIISNLGVVGCSVDFMYTHHGVYLLHKSSA